MSAPYFDIGGVPDRPTQPPEPDISERDLAAIRARAWREIEDEAECMGWWESRTGTEDRIDYARIAMNAYLGGAGGQAVAQSIAVQVMERAVEERVRELMDSPP